MTESSFIHIPPELQDLIIELLLDLNRSCLSTSSLVCKAWRHRSYERAFSSVSLYRRSISGLASFLDSAFSSSAIFTRVRRVRIVGDADYRLETPSGLESSSWNSIQLGALSKLLHHLADVGQVSTLVLSNLNWAVVDPAMTLSLSELRHIESLSMDHVRLAHSHQLSDFVAMFRTLRVLDFQSIECPSVDVSGSRDLIKRYLAEPDDRLDFGQCCLTLNGSGRRMLEKQITWVYPGPMPREMGFSVLSCGVQTSFRSDASDLLKSLGNLLTHLEICSTENFATDPTIASLDLSTNTSLKHLHLSSPDRVISVISWIPYILENIAISNLETLHISFAQTRQFYLDRPFIKLLAHILEGESSSRYRFTKLRLIKFTASAKRCSTTTMAKGIPEFNLGEAGRNKITECIHSCLPFWDGRGVVVVDFH